MLATHLKNMLADKVLVSPRKDGRTILREKGVMDLEIADIPSSITIVNMRRIGSLSGVKDGEWNSYGDRCRSWNTFVPRVKYIIAPSQPNWELLYAIP